MLGTIIGDLVAWTWEHDRACFYKQLVREDAVLSCYGTTLYNAAHTFFLPEKKVDVAPMGFSRELLYCNAIKCSRCNGSGYLPQYEHVENGICFRCWGEGVALESLE